MEQISFLFELVWQCCLQGIVSGNLYTYRHEYTLYSEETILVHCFEVILS